MTAIDGPIVSLTSYGARIKNVYLTIESIGRGRILPSKLILWIDDLSVLSNIPVALKRLQARGLTISYTYNYGPHKKYFPYVNEEQHFMHPLVTGDDDVLYPKYWLAELVANHHSYPNVINCFRARRIVFTDQRLAKYADWKACSSTNPSFATFATGVSGVLYPPSFLCVLKEAGSKFEDCCPRADDIWLHQQAVKAGYRVRQVRTKALHFLGIPGSQTESLYKINASQMSGNDTQASATYEQRDLDRILMEVDDSGRR